jgi:hypothetical protein
MPCEGELGLSSVDTGDSPSLIDRRSLASGPIDLLAAQKNHPRERHFGTSSTPSRDDSSFLAAAIDRY